MGLFLFVIFEGGGERKATQNKGKRAREFTQEEKVSGRPVTVANSSGEKKKSLRRREKLGTRPPSSYKAGFSYLW